MKNLPTSYFRLFTAMLMAIVFFQASISPALAQSSYCGKTYKVLPNDTLYFISVRCQVPYAVLVGINVELSDPDSIYPGQIIRLEAGAPLTVQPASGPAEQGGLQPGGVYVVRKGDSLARIAFLYRTTVAELTRMNPEVGEYGLIYPGQEIKLPPDARLERGWVGVSQTLADPGDPIQVNVVDFPPYADIDIRIGELGARYTKAYDAKTDARGEAVLVISMPYTAWYDEVWVVEVVATEDSDPVTAMSAAITIEGY